MFGESNRKWLRRAPPQPGRRHVGGDGGSVDGGIEGGPASTGGRP